MGARRSMRRVRAMQRHACRRCDRTIGLGDLCVRVLEADYGPSGPYGGSVDVYYLCRPCADNEEEEA